MTYNTYPNDVRPISELGLPEYDDITNAPAEDGTLVRVTGDGATTPAGAYYREDGSYDGPIGLLATAGYTQGDDLWLQSTGEGAAINVETSGTWVGAVNFHQDILQWDALFPDGATTRVYAIVAGNPGSGETLDARLQNLTDSETIVQVTDIGGGQTLLGPVTYTPTTTASPIQVVLEIQTSPGSNPSQVVNITGGYGVQL